MPFFSHKPFVVSFATPRYAVSTGGKHIFSSKIKSSDVMELTRNKVEISSSMSFELQAAVGSEANEAKAAIKEASKSDDDDGPDADDDTAEDGADSL